MGRKGGTASNCAVFRVCFSRLSMRTVCQRPSEESQACFSSGANLGHGHTARPAATYFISARLMGPNMTGPAAAGLELEQVTRLNLTGRQERKLETKAEWGHFCFLRSSSRVGPLTLLWSVAAGQAPV